MRKYSSFRQRLYLAISLFVFFFGAYRWITKLTIADVERIELASREPEIKKNKPKINRTTEQNVQTAKPQVSSAEEESPLDVFLKKENPKIPLDQWKVRMNSAGQLIQITGGHFSDKRIGEAGAESLVKDLAEVFGFSADDLKASEFQYPGTDELKAYRFQQYYQRHPVFQSSISVFESLKKKAFFGITSELKPIDESNSDFKINVTQESAQQKALSTVSEFKETKVNPHLYNKNQNDPWVFVNPDQSAELAWVFEVSFNKPYFERRLVVISAQSGKILATQSLIKY